VKISCMRDHASDEQANEPRKGIAAPG